MHLYSHILSGCCNHFKLLRIICLGTTVPQMIKLHTALNCQNTNVKAIEDFFRVYIASSKHERDWKNSRQLCKHETQIPDPNDRASRSNLTFPLPPLFTPATQAAFSLKKKDSKQGFPRSPTSFGFTLQFPLPTGLN